MEDEQVQTDFMQLWNWDKLNSTTSNKMMLPSQESQIVKRTALYLQCEL